MKLETFILGRNWKLFYTNNRTSSDIGGVTYFPAREIVIREDWIEDEQLLHVITHEITHAYLYELGRGQDINKNGSFVVEFISELMAIHGKSIVDSSAECLRAIQNERKRRNNIKKQINKGLPK